MNIKQSEYANKDQQEGIDAGPGECRAQRDWPPLSRSELASFLYTCGLLPHPAEQRRDRGDGDER